MKRWISLLLFCLISLTILSSSKKIPERYKDCHNIVRQWIDKKDKRYKTFVTALQLIQDRNLQVLIETGTTRSGCQNCIGDGCGSAIFGQWVLKKSGIFYSVDISPSAIEQAMCCLPSDEKIHFICDDSVSFLSQFNHPIDFLYLDSYDFDSNNPAPSQEHHLKEIIAAYPNLHEKSVILIDDCRLAHGGKGKLAIDFLVRNGWEVYMNAYQILLIRKNSL